MNRIPKILITREQEELGVLTQMVGVEFVCVPLLNIKLLPIEDSLDGDVYVYYSKNGVKAMQNAGWFAHEKVRGAIHMSYGSATARFLQELGLPNVIDGKASVRDIVHQIEAFHPKKRIVIVRASNSLKSIQSALNKDFPYDEIIAYTNVINEKVKSLPLHDFAYITSPSQGDRYQKLLVQKPKWIFLIGASTATSFKNSHLPYTVLETPDDRCFRDTFYEKLKTFGNGESNLS